MTTAERIHAHVDASATVARNSDVVGAELQGGLVLLQTTTWSYLDLNETGVAVWSNLEKPQPLASLVDALTAEFAVDAGRCYQEVAAFIEDLSARKFVTINAAPASDPV